MSKKLGLTLCFVLVPLSLFTYPGPAQDQARKAQDGTCLILVDGTASVDAPRLTDALKRFREAVPPLAKACTKVRTGVFSDEGGFVSLSPPIPLPSVPVLQDCTQVAANAVNLKDDPASGLPGVRDFKQEETRIKCADQNKALRLNYQLGLDSAISQIQSSIPETVKVKTGCTAIVGLIEHLVSPPSPSIIFMVSDAEETCSPGPKPQIRIPAGTRVILVLVPKHGAINVEGPQALKRGEMWKAAMSGLIVLTYTDISAETINRLLLAPLTNRTEPKVR
jgi:hypothetical protein